MKPKMTASDVLERDRLIASTCQKCCGFGGHGEHSSIGKKNEFWQKCVACDGTGRRKQP